MSVHARRRKASAETARHYTLTDGLKGMSRTSAENARVKNQKEQKCTAIRCVRVVGDSLTNLAQGYKCVNRKNPCGGSV